MYVFQPPTYWGQVKSLTLDGLFAKMHRKNLEMVTSEDGYIAWGSLSVLNVILWQGLSSLQAVTRSMGAPHTHQNTAVLSTSQISWCGNHALEERMVTLAKSSLPILMEKKVPILSSHTLENTIIQSHQ